MLNAMSILRRIEATGRRAEKEELLGELAKDEIGLLAIKYAYDPFITFGIRPSRRDPEDVKGGRELTAAVLRGVCDKLAKRLLTGNAAEGEIFEVMNYLDEDGAELLYRVLSKDLRCGVAENTINSVVPGVIPTFCVMRAHAFEEKRVKKWPVAVEPKMDGFRYTFIYRNGVGGFFTRSGKPATSVDHVTKAVVDMANYVFLSLPKDSKLRQMLATGSDDPRNPISFVLDGEMIAGEFHETSGALRRQDEAAVNARFHVFDIMSWEDFDAVGSVGLPYEERRKLVEEFTELAKVNPEWVKLITRTPRYLCNNMDQVRELYTKFRERKLEGAMVKMLDGLYDKKKSYGWMKIKPEETEDLQIVGWFPGEEGTKYAASLGGLVVQRIAPGIGPVLVRVGGGFTDAERDLFHERIQKDISRADKAAVYQDKDMHLVKTDVMGIADQCDVLFNLAEIEYHEVTPDGSLRHPRFVRLRTDKRGEVESKEKAA